MSLSNKYFSHPGKSLCEHLRAVAENSRCIVEGKKLNLDEFTDAKTLADISFIIGAAHDFGKFTRFFQEYLFANDKKKQTLKSRKETHHGAISSLLVYFWIREYLEKNGLAKKEYYEYLPIIASLVVKRHHGDLKDALHEIVFDENDVEIFRKQLEATNVSDVNTFYSDLLKDVLSAPVLPERFLSLENIDREIVFASKQKVRRLEDKNSLFFYTVTLFLYSVLLDADKSDAAELLKFKPTKLSPASVDEYKTRKFGATAEGINAIREEIYDEAISSVKKIDLKNEKLFLLNVPTGSGKTLTSFSFSLKLRDRIEKELGYSPKIIYSLPFLSIIEQNYDAISEVLGNPPSNVLLKHHHLSDVTYKTDDDEFGGNVADADKSLLLIEGWNADVVFTTFAQFFYSIITNKNRAARKFHNIVNSIVIFDEIQALPHKYWLLLDELVTFLADKFNIYFLIMTATHPLIFEQAKEIVPDKEKYFKVLDRYDLKIDAGKKSLEEFLNELSAEIRENDAKDYLVVMNTINASLQVYEALKAEFEEEAEIYYLSTNIVPKERIARIKKIKQSKSRKIIVSTQMIEAGVDISANVVVRDFAPLDAVNQTAGRCNRNFAEERGVTKLVNLFTESENTNRIYLPKKIYDEFLLSKTEETLSGITDARESDFLNFTNEYFMKVGKAKSDDESKKILAYAQTLEFENFSDFKLIKEDYVKVDIFVETDAEAEKIWKQYEEIRENADLTPLQRKNEFLKIRKSFYDYVISVPKNYAAPNFEEDKINHISFEEIDGGNFYDIETGFKRNNDSEGILGI